MIENSAAGRLRFTLIAVNAAILNEAEMTKDRVRQLAEVFIAIATGIGMILLTLYLVPESFQRASPGLAGPVIGAAFTLGVAVGWLVLSAVRRAELKGE